jgi:Tol biopolymer transport system component/DNA-binding winged helix-turn-helix (wHTH) protein
METSQSPRYQFGEFVLDPARRSLLRNGEPVPLTPKALDTLLLLVRHGGQIVSKETLLNEIWPDAFVEEATLSQNVFTIRRALGQKPEGAQFIETVPKRGYRFVAEIHEQPSNDDLIIERHTHTQIFTEEREYDQRLSGPLQTDAIEIPKVVALTARAPAFSYRKRNLLVAVFTVVVIAGAALVVWMSSRKDERRAQAWPGHITKLTSNGNVVRATISPDGTYVVYSCLHGGHESLWVKQIGSSREIEIVPAADVKYRGLTFSPDGTAIYYSRYDKNNAEGQLFRSPLLGGAPVPVLADIDSAIAFSPDGKRISFFRNFLDEKSPVSFSTALVVADIDGMNQHVLVTYHMLFSSEGPAWSPATNKIIFPMARTEIDPNRLGLIEVDVDTAAQTPVTPFDWNSIGQVSWVPHENAVVFDGWNETISSTQLWKANFPAGNVEQLTNDLNSYSGSAFGGNALVTTRADRIAAFWVSNAPDAHDATQITSGEGDRSGELLNFSWTADGRLVFGSVETGQPEIWLMNSDGSNKTQVTIDAKANLRPSASKAGEIAFVSRRTGESHIWLMKADGSEQRQITNQENESGPSISPDGKWIAYVGYDHGLPRLWKTSSDGNQKILLNEKLATRPVVSPDGSSIACLYEERPIPFRHIAIIPASGGPPEKTFELPSDVATNPGIRWTPDKLGIAFVREVNGVANVWVQPLNGGAPKQLTNFPTAKIYRFAWSLDGTRLALERGVDVQDVVLFRTN